MKNRIVLLSALLTSALFVGCKPEAKSGAAQTSGSSSKESPKITAKLEAIRQAGYPVTVAELEQWMPTPPPDQNAATKYTEAFAALVKPPAKGYVVYSVGRDGADDGGKEKAAGSTGDSGFDVTFIVER